ncbi:MAG: hypothetical protein JJ913_10355 [Rhizobiaceae bacterium]|nr:hypothetical protein [Rhizobiaceae bacterium]
MKRIIASLALFAFTSVPFAAQAQDITGSISGSVSGAVDGLGLGASTNATVEADVERDQRRHHRDRDEIRAGASVDWGSEADIRRRNAQVNADAELEAGLN